VFQYKSKLRKPALERERVKSLVRFSRTWPAALAVYGDQVAHDVRCAVADMSKETLRTFACLIELTAEHGAGFTVRASDFADGLSSNLARYWIGCGDRQAIRSLRDRYGLVVSQQHYLGEKKLPLDACLRLPDPADPSRSVRPVAREPEATTEPVRTQIDPPSMVAAFASQLGI
jgi:hypothetical protein